MRRRVALAVLLGLLLVALTAFWMAGGFGGGGDPTARPSPRDGPSEMLSGVPTLQGDPLVPRAAGAPPAPPEAMRVAIAPASINVHGRVTDTKGAPVRNAQVFLLPKEVRGARSREGVPRATTREDGRFSLNAAPAGRWLAVLSHEHPPRYLDGDALDVGAELDVQLEVGAEVTVTVRDAASGGPYKKSVSVDVSTGPWEAGEWALPGPDGPHRISAGGTLDGESDSATFSIGTRGPLDVSALAWGGFVEPESVHLAGPGGTAAFLVFPSCGVRARVTDAPTKSPIAGTIFLFVRKAGTDKVVNGLMQITAHGEIELRDRIGPGSYDVTIGCKGYREWRREGLVLGEHGQVVELEAALQPGSDKGEVALTLPVRPDPAVSRGIVMIALRRTDVADGSWRSAGGFEPGADGSTYAWSDCPPGTYDALVLVGRPRQAGLVRGLRVDAGRRAAATVTLVPGLEVRLADLVRPAADLASVGLSSPDLGELPLMELGPHWSWLRDPGETPTADPWAVLGPYPVESLHVRIEREMGEPIEADLRR